MAKPIPNMTDADKARFWSKVDILGPCDCWLWTASTNAGSYGTFGIGSNSYLATRVALAIDGRNPLNFLACHTCDNPRCCNPAHLWIGTNADNAADCRAKGRKVTRYGESVSNSKLTAAVIPIIRSDTRLLRVIAAEYGVSRPLIGMIKRRISWKHVA